MAMQKLLRLFVLGTLALASLCAWPKSQTVQLEITGPGLAAPLQITERTVLARFSIWNGPGVRMNGKPVHLARDNQERIGAFIDWSQGALRERPRGSDVYTITFHQGGREQMHDWHRRYVVMYQYDSAAEAGYIYLPGPVDGEVYQRNAFSIGHGVEGNWFHASAAWERLVRPLIQNAAARGVSR